MIDLLVMAWSLAIPWGLGFRGLLLIETKCVLSALHLQASDGLCTVTPREDAQDLDGTLMGPACCRDLILVPSNHGVSAGSSVEVPFHTSSSQGQTTKPHRTLLRLFLLAHIALRTYMQPLLSSWPWSSHAAAAGNPATILLCCCAQTRQPPSQILPSGYPFTITGSYLTYRVIKSVLNVPSDLQALGEADY
jgi:hypothetical protein